MHIIFILIVVITVSGFAMNQERPLHPAPNIIFIMADDLGYGDLGCYGQKKILTPNIDKMAQEGIRFFQFYSGSTVCAPARSVLMTGHHTGHTRVRDNKCKVGGTTVLKNGKEIRRMNLLSEDLTVADLLKQAGYRTGLVGKWHLGGYNPEAGPLDRGFDEFYGKLTRTKHGPAYWPEMWYYNRELREVKENLDGKRGLYRTDLNTDNAIMFIEKNRSRPFFLYLAYGNPHSPYDAPDYGPYADNDWPHEEKTYAAMIHYLDLSVKRILETLKNMDLDERTIVFFCSDNGPRSESDDVQTRVVRFFDSNGPLQGYKRDLYEGGIRVPMIVRWPGKIPKGRTSNYMWYFADFMATAAELAGIAVPQKIDGISVVKPLLDPELTLNDRFLYWEIHQGGFRQAVRWKNWKMIRPGIGFELLLFDLTSDIGEDYNLADKNPEIVKVFKSYLSTARNESPNWPINSE